MLARTDQKRSACALAAVAFAFTGAAAPTVDSALAGQGNGGLRAAKDHCEGLQEHAMPATWAIHKQLAADGLSDIKVCIDLPRNIELAEDDETQVVTAWMAKSAHFHALQQDGTRTALKGRCAKCHPLDTCAGKTLLPMPTAWKTHADMTAKGRKNIGVCMHVEAGVANLDGATEAEVLELKASHRAHFHFTLGDKPMILRWKDQ